MIYLSAQPDDLYFLWQLKLQIFNFANLGICKNDIHVLIGFQKDKGLNQEFVTFIETNNDALFYLYEDTRSQSSYLSSIRPHIIYKHFLQYPFLEKETIFYHDSDVILRKEPDWNKYLHNKVWYASNTRSYIGYNYIITSAGQNIFENMCNIVSIDKNIVLLNDVNAGGAQYLLKECNAFFWEKVECDSENLYTYLLNEFQSTHKFDNFRNPFQLQIWCSDMWAFWWNALKENKKFEIIKELDFSWANSSLIDSEDCPILHYTGDINNERTAGKYFRKVNYAHFDPFYEDYTNIDKTSCSSLVIQLIEKYKQEVLDKNRISLMDTTFVIIANNKSHTFLELIKSVLKYLLKYFRTTICLIEINEKQYLDKSELPQGIQYHFMKDDICLENKETYIGDLLATIKTSYVCFYDPQIIVPIYKIIESVKLLRNNESRAVSSFNSIRYVDVLTTKIFQKVIDDQLFIDNEGKMLDKNEIKTSNVFFTQKNELTSTIFKLFFEYDLYPIDTYSIYDNIYTIDSTAYVLYS